MAIPGKFEAAVNPDMSADPLSFTWVDLTADTQANKATITRGRRSSGASQTEAGSLVVPLNNGSGDYTPYRAASPYHPHMRRGRVVARHSVNTGARYLALTGVAGSKASTADAASLDIVSDLAFAVQLRSPIRTPAGGFVFDTAGKWGAAGQRSWRLILGAAGAAFFQWSADGTATTGEASTSLVLPRPDAGPVTLAGEFDVNNGAAGNTLTWYLLKGTITDLLADKTAYLFGDPDINTGTTSIFSSTATLEVGDIASSGFLALPGGIERFFLRAGTLTSGTIAADADFTAEVAGTTSFADDAATPKTWTVAGGAEITDRKTTITGHLAQADGDFPGHGVAGTAQRTWQIAGPLRRMRQGTPLLKSALYRRITAPVTDTTVYGYWPLEDGKEATQAFSPIGGIPGGGVAMTLAADDTLTASSPLPNVSGGQPFGWNMRMAPVAALSTGWEASWLMNLALAPTGAEVFDQRVPTTGGTTSQWIVRFEAGNFRVVAKDNSGGNALTDATSSDARMFGQWVIVMLTVAEDGADIDWDLDIIPLDGQGTVFGDGGTLAGFSLGSPLGFGNLQTAAPGDGVSVGHFTITQGAVSGWLAPADSAYAGEPDTERVGRLFREEGVPMLVDGPLAADGSNATSIAAGAVAMGPQRPGLSLLDYLDEAAQVSGGLYGEATELLGLTYRSGVTLLNQPARITPTTEVTGPEGGGDFKPADSDQDFVNDATVTRTEGSSASFTDEESVTADGRYDRSKTINRASDSGLQSDASWWVHEATWPEERFDEIAMELAKNSGTLIDTWFDVSMGDRLEIAQASLPDVVAERPVSQLIDGWTMEVSPHLFTVRAATRPAGPFEVGVLDDADRGKLDTAGSTLSTGIDDNDTSLSVATTLGPLWDPADAEDGFDIDIGGEQVTVTDISGSSSPQTFTVTRSVNGVVKSHSSGAAVSLWRPTVLAP